MPTKMQSPGAPTRPGTLAWASLAVVWLVWGSTYLGIRVAVQSMPPLIMTGSRYAIAGVLLSLIVWIAQGRPRVRLSVEEIRSVFILAVLLLVVGNGLLAISEVHLQSGTAALLVATVSLWMIVLDAIVSRRLRLLPLLGVALGMFGVLALSGAPSAHASPVSVIMVLAGSLSWAVGSVYARRRASHQTGALLLGFEMFVAGVIQCILGILGGELGHIGPVSEGALAGWLWLIFAGAMIGYSAYGYAVRTLPTNVVATYAYVNPIVAVGLGALVLREPITIHVLAGGAAIVLSVITIVLGNRRSEDASQQRLKAA